jgi:hypothetical protein
LQANLQIANQTAIAGYNNAIIMKIQDRYGKVMASLTFFKMHGLGNDFMVFDAIHQDVQLSPNQIRRWANRHTGVGFDQLLLVESLVLELQLRHTKLMLQIISVCLQV